MTTLKTYQRKGAIKEAKLYLHKGQRLSLQDIAKMESIPIGTIRTRMRIHPSLTITECACIPQSEFRNRVDPRAHQFFCRGRNWTIRQAAEFLNINLGACKSRIERLGIERTLNGEIKSNPGPLKQGKGDWDATIPVFDTGLAMRRLAKVLSPQQVEARLNVLQ